MKSKTLKHKLYFSMLRIRMIEEYISLKYSEQQMRCPVHLSIGQEAVAVGVINNLKNSDKILSAHRAHAHYIAKNGNLKKMIAELYGKTNGCAGGKGGSMHLIDLNSGFFAAVPIVGSTIPIAVGLSWSHKLQNINNQVVVFFGDGATEEGVFFESIDFSVLKNIPILFICENNLYSVYTRINERQSKQRQLYKIAKSHGLYSFKCEGNDVLKVNDVTKKALNYIKKNRKPAFIEFSTYRWLEHCGPNWDDELNYRPKGELTKWIKKCPIKKLEKEIIKFNPKDKKILLEYESKIYKEIEYVFKSVKDSKFPTKKELYTNVYSR